MSKFLKIVIPVVVILVVAIWLFFKPHPIPGGPGWDKTIQQSTNPFGMVRVYEPASGTTLFWHHSEPDALPIRIERSDDNHWVVVLERAPK